LVNLCWLYWLEFLLYVYSILTLFFFLFLFRWLTIQDGPGTNVSSVVLCIVLDLICLPINVFTPANIHTTALCAKEAVVLQDIYAATCTATMAGYWSLSVHVGWCVKIWSNSRSTLQSMDMLIRTMARTSNKTTYRELTF
jgi:hypothetical protein